MQEESKQKGPIGIFDSGFGGLTLLKEMVKELPFHNYLYFADTARAPYGSRSQDVIYHFTEQAVDFLLSRNCQLIILACNTASSEALRRIQKEFLPNFSPEKRVLGVIVPAAEAAVAVSRKGRIGVMATEATVASGAFERELKKLSPGIKVFQSAAPLLVPLVEEGEHNSEIAEIALQRYLSYLIKQDIDTLVLGCTHYSLLEDKIKQIVGPQVQVISEGKIVAQRLKDYLIRHPEIAGGISQFGKTKFLTSDITGKFKTLGSQFFGKPIEPKRVIIL